MANEVSIKLDSEHKGESTDFSVFAHVCDATRLTLAHVSRCIGAAGKPEFKISELQTGSAMVGLLAPTPVEREAAAIFNRTITDLESGKAPDERLDYQALKSFERFSRPVSTEGVLLDIGTTRLTSHYVANLKELLSPQSAAFGSVSGRLERLSTHRSTTFTLWPPISGEQVECRFTEERLSDVVAAINKHVTVAGLLHYGTNKSFPIRVDVDEFEVHPDNDELPSLLDCCGVLKTKEGGADDWE